MEESRKGKSRFPLLLVGVLAAGFLMLGGYNLYQARQNISDPELLAELQNAPLATGEHAGLDWPQWRGLNRDGIGAGTGLLREWPASGPEILWEARTGAGYSSLAVAAGRVFTMVHENGQEAVICWDSATGKELWRHRYPAHYQGDYGPGPRSTPTVDQDRVYALGAAGMLHCLAVADGKVLWSRDLLREYSAPMPHWGVACSPLVEGDQLIVIVGAPDASVVSFDKYSGKPRWQSQSQEAGYSSPLAADLAGVRQLLIFNANSLVSLAPNDGQLLWGHSWATSHGANIATPIAAGDFVFISSGYGKGCAVLKVARDGDELAAQVAYRHTRLRNHHSSSVLWEDHLYGFDEHALVCMNFRTGEICWRDSTVGKGSLIVADGQLIALGESGQLVLAPASPAGFQPTARWQFSERRCWSLPALSGDRLYLRDEERLVCIRVKKS